MDEVTFFVFAQPDADRERDTVNVMGVNQRYSVKQNLNSPNIVYTTYSFASTAGASAFGDCSRLRSRNSTRNSLSRIF